MVELPEPGPLRVGPVDLPPGKVLRSRRPLDGTSPQAVAWVTVDPVPDAGHVWRQLSGLHYGTGLAPILLGTLEGQPRRPWDEEEFGVPVDLREVDEVDPAGFLEEWWHGSLPEDDDVEEQEMWEPFGRAFPGLALADGGRLARGGREQVLDSRPLARIGLVAASRPADVLAAVGWSGTANWGGLGGFRDYLIPFTAMLRSWEDRFGARLFEVGFDEIRLLVERPPRTRELAEHLAAEHFQLANDCTDGARGIPWIASRLIDSAYWTFWWD